MTNTTNTTVSINASQIADQESFEELRLSALREGGDSYTDLAAATELTDGVTLQDKVIEEALDQDESEAALAAAKNRVHKAAGKTGLTLYDIEVDTVDGSVANIRKRTILAQDEAATSKQRRMADQIGYGPKSNDSSFVNPQAVPRR